MEKPCHRLGTALPDPGLEKAGQPLCLNRVCEHFAIAWERLASISEDLRWNNVKHGVPVTYHYALAEKNVGRLGIVLLLSEEDSV